MRFWYFKFEGRFLKGSPEHNCKGVFSGCLVPVSNYKRAKKMFLRALKENEIELVETIEHFDVNGEELDPEDKQNTFWIRWYKQAEKSQKPVFDKWHVFDD